jgi:peptide deformylase
MPVRPLVLYPDPLLFRPAEAVEGFGPDLDALAADVRDTLAEVSAIGLTAPHIGVLRRLVVIRMAPDVETQVYVNPAILWASPETASHEEGSVSMPGARDRITRPARVRIGYRALAGGEREEELGDFSAAVMQHEIDQLDGLFWTGRLSRLRRERLMKRYAKPR